MQISQIRKTYEKYPYPAADKTALTKVRWNLAPIEWINALWKPNERKLAPKRILVAGCGTGREAFMLRRRFRKARIVAVDFSPRSISIARDLQQRAREMRNIRFFAADLATRNLGKITGGDFDFISCHGVLSYVPSPARVLANLKRQLKPDGALYLGVNGAEHFSARGRLFLPAFGFDLAELRDGPYLRKVLKLWDAILDHRGSAPFAKFSLGYLAGDLFGSLIHNLPLSDWVRLAREAGLHFQASYSSWHGLRSAMEKDYPQLLMPRSRAEVCELLEYLRPEFFHRLLFTRQPPANPPWESQEALRNCRPALTSLYAVRLPKRSRSWQALRRLRFKSPAMNTQLDWQMPEWEVEILRQSDGWRTLSEILGRISAVVPQQQLRQQLYILHQLLVITLMPDSTGMGY
jgi:SAM-dependent methyltransferase